MLLLCWQLALGVLVIVPPVFFASRWFRRGSNMAYLEVRERISTIQTSKRVSKVCASCRPTGARDRSPSASGRPTKTSTKRTWSPLGSRRSTSRSSSTPASSAPRRSSATAAGSPPGASSRSARSPRSCCTSTTCSSRSTSSASSTTSCSRRARRCRSLRRARHARRDQGAAGRGRPPAPTARSTSTGRFAYGTNDAGAARRHAPRLVGRAAGARGPDRRREVDAGQAHRPVLRPEWARCASTASTSVTPRCDRCASAIVVVPAGGFPVRGNAPRQRARRPARGDRRRGRGRAARCSACSSGSRRSPTASTPRCASAAHGFRRRAPARVARTRGAGRSVGARARRSDVEPRPRHRAPGRAGDGEADARAHDHRRRAPAVDRGARRPDRCRVRRPAGRARLARGARRARRPLRRALPNLVRPPSPPATWLSIPSSGRSRRTRTSSIRGTARAAWSRRFTPTPKMNPSGPSNATSVKPAVSNHFRMSAVRSGSRRCRVQITVAPGAHRDGSVSMVRTMSASEMLPNTPHASTISAGTAPRRPTSATHRRTRPRRRAGRRTCQLRSCGGRARPAERARRRARA